MTPGRPLLPQTPTLNDNSRFGTHDFPPVPKFGRSESTPELHRIRKLEFNITEDKSHNRNELRNFFLTRNKCPSLSHLEKLRKSSFSTCKLPSGLSETEESMSAFTPLLSVPIKSAAVVAEVQPVNPIPQSKLIHPVSDNNLLPPPNARPTPKTNQIAVNGKLYTVMNTLGRGGSSFVYQVLNQELTDIFALKVVLLESVDEVTAEGYINEVRLLKQLQGLPRVVRLLEYEYNEEEEKLLLVMEKGDADFATFIKTRTSLNSIDPTLIRFYWKEMLEAVKEIHDQNVIHTDLKPGNFLLVHGCLKLIDFGIAFSIQADMTSVMKDSQCGTCNYMAPEAIKSAAPAGTNKEYKISRKTDVWSLGCMLYSLVYKNPPFNKFRDIIGKLSAIVDERYVIDFPLTADPLVIEVLKGCLDRNPRNRPSIEELLFHPYLTAFSLQDPPPLAA